VARPIGRTRAKEKSTSFSVAAMVRVNGGSGNRTGPTPTARRFGAADADSASTARSYKPLGQPATTIAAMPMHAPSRHITATSLPTPALELWGGHECTVNRVGDAWYDQTPRSGHDRRIEDLALFAGTGMRSIRYPALWETMAPGGGETREFAGPTSACPRWRAWASTRS
jgi:hypothetical protein